MQAFLAINIIILFASQKVLSVQPIPPTKTTPTRPKPLDQVLISPSFEDPQIQLLLADLQELPATEQPPSEKPLSDQLAELAALELPISDPEEIIAQLQHDRILELLDEHSQEIFGGDLSGVSGRISSLLKKLVVLRALQAHSKEAEGLEIAHFADFKIEFDIAEIVEEVIEDVRSIEAAERDEAQLALYQIQAVTRLLGQSLFDSLTQVELLLLLLKEYRKVLEENQRMIVLEILESEGRLAQIEGLDAENLADRFAEIFRAIFALGEQGEPSFVEPSVFFCLRVVFRKYFRLLEAGTAGPAQRAFMLKMLRQVIGFLLEKEKGKELVFGLLGNFLQVDDKRLIFIKNNCRLFKAKFEKGGLPLEQYDAGSSKDKALFQHFILDMLYQFSICNYNPFSDADFRGLAARLEIIVDAPQEYFRLKASYPKIFFDQTADAGADFELFDDVYSLLLRMKVEQEAGLGESLNRGMDAFVDLLSQRPLKKDEPFYVDVREKLVLLKFIAAFQQEANSRPISIPKIDDGLFEYSIDFLKRCKFESFKKFVEIIYSNIFGVDLPKGHDFEFIREFNDFTFPNEVLGFTIHRKKCDSPRRSISPDSSISMHK